ncbi:T9SS type A sorting domain-containing protein, partial [Candidatus Uhrbacteria bacterium]|nr:T9SS type A sorting domain-containing protein [Candidatus Uhrbacteria bacterium]
DIYAQMIDVDSTLMWDPAGVPVCENEASQAYPLVVPGGIGGVIIAWEDERNPTYDQYAQRVDGSGAVKWTLDGISVCTYPSAQQHAAIASDELGGAIVVWDDDRPMGSKDIYAQRIYYNGDVATGITPFPQRPLALRSAYPNPFNPATTISYDLPETGWTKVAIYDVNGRLVRTLVDQRQEDGEHAETWDGRDDRGVAVPTGVYFVRLESGGEVRSAKTALLK